MSNGIKKTTALPTPILTRQLNGIHFNRIDSHRCCIYELCTMYILEMCECDMIIFGTDAFIWQPQPSENRQKARERERERLFIG